MKVALRGLDSDKSAVLGRLVKEIGGEIVEGAEDICLFEGKTAVVKSLLLNRTHDLLAGSAVGDKQFVLLRRRAA